MKLARRLIHTSAPGRVSNGPLFSLKAVQMSLAEYKQLYTVLPVHIARDILKQLAAISTAKQTSQPTLRQISSNTQKFIGDSTVEVANYLMTSLQVDKEKAAISDYVRILLAANRPRAARLFLQSIPSSSKLDSSGESITARSWLLILRHFINEPEYLEAFFVTHYPQPVSDEAWCIFLSAASEPWTYVDKLKDHPLSVQAELLKRCVTEGKMAEADVVWKRIADIDKPYAQCATIMYLFATEGPKAVERWVRSLNTQLDEQARATVWKLMISPNIPSEVLTSVPDLEAPSDCLISNPSKSSNNLIVSPSASTDAVPHANEGGLQLNSNQNLPVRLLTKSQAIDILSIQESISQYPAPGSAYEEILRLCQPHDKMAVYIHSQEQNLIPTPNMITDICMCDSIPLDERFQVYLDMPLDRPELLPQLDLITNKLLAACAETPGSHNTSLSILLDMSKLDLTISPVDPVASIIKSDQTSESSSVRNTSRLNKIVTGLMDHAPDPTIAYQLYSRVHALSPFAFTPTTYALALRSISETFAGRMTVSLHIFTHIMKDMRHSGHPPTGAIYKALLWHYSHGRKTTKNNMKAISTRDLRAVMNIHTIIKVDSTLKKIDYSLLNSLMLAYKDLSDWANFWKTWESILMRIRTNPRKENNPDVHTSLLLAFDAACVVRDPQKVCDLKETCELLKMMPADKLFAPYVTALARSGQPFMAVQELIDDVSETSSTKDEMMRECILKSLDAAEVDALKRWVFESNLQRIWPTSSVTVGSTKSASETDWTMEVILDDTERSPDIPSSRSVIQRTQRITPLPALNNMTSPAWDADISLTATEAENVPQKIFERVRRLDGIVTPMRQGAEMLSDEERIGSRGGDKRPFRPR